MDKKVYAHIVSLLKENKKTQKGGIVSVCSAHPSVLDAAIIHASQTKSPLVIEATSNQVNQFGGYTGMNPYDFVKHTKSLCKKNNYPFEKVLLGGDHLGPNAWKDEISSQAMKKASQMIKDYVKAGFVKIHLDTSMPCADDLSDGTLSLSDEVVAARAAVLCKVAEETYQTLEKSFLPPLYIIGTEVPVPGGAKEEIKELELTDKEDARKTIEVTKNAFFVAGLRDAWDRVIALVVQPGVEFSHENVIQYDSSKSLHLQSLLREYPSLVYEVHSSDYQSASSLKNLVEDSFCIVKVGPWLTYAYREALFLLEHIETILHEKTPFTQLSDLQSTVFQVLGNNNQYWKGYYEEGEGLSLQLLYSYSDRMRYYWSNDTIQKSVSVLLNNLEFVVMPNTLISQYFPNQYLKILEKRLEPTPNAIIIDKIRDVLTLFTDACET